MLISKNLKFAGALAGLLALCDIGCTADCSYDRFNGKKSQSSEEGILDKDYIRLLFGKEVTELTSTYSNVAWEQLWDGAYFQNVDVKKDNQIVDSLAMVRFDPLSIEMKILTTYKPNSANYKPNGTNHKSNGRKQAKAKFEFNAGEWRKHPTIRDEANIVVVNSSYYEPNGEPTAYIKADGKKIGGSILSTLPLDEKISMMQAMLGFNSGEQLKLLDINYDNKAMPYGGNTIFEELPYHTAVQTKPVLLDRKGEVRVKKTDMKAYRTVIASDFDGNIYTMTSKSDFFTLYELGLFLKSLEKEDGTRLFYTIANLDGGHAAEMYVSAAGRAPFIYGSFIENTAEQEKIPTVIAFTSRR